MAATIEEVEFYTHIGAMAALTGTSHLAMKRGEDLTGNEALAQASFALLEAMLHHQKKLALAEDKVRESGMHPSQRGRMFEELLEETFSHGKNK